MGNDIITSRSGSGPARGDLMQSLPTRLGRRPLMMAFFTPCRFHIAEEARADKWDEKARASL